MRRGKERGNDQINSFIGKGVQFEGKLIFNGLVKIDGHFKGEIKATAGNLIIGDEGVVEGDIHASSVFCTGEARGRIVADKAVDFQMPGKIVGDVQAPTIVIQEGVHFEGRCETVPAAKKTDPAEKKTLTPAQPFRASEEPVPK